MTLFSGDSIPWQRYGTDGVTIQADTYTFFPFYAPNSDRAIVSHGQTYAKEAYVVRFHASSENLFLTDVIYYTRRGIIPSDIAKYYTSLGVILLHFSVLYPIRRNTITRSLTLYLIGYIIVFMNEIAIFVKQKRKEAGLTQEEFAIRSGLGLRFVRELEQGKETVRMDKVNQALAMFGMEAVPGRKDDN